jgi:chromate transporter
MNSELSTDTALKHPQSKTELFFVFTVVALQGFGGVLAIIQHELVERRKWLSKAQFVEEWSVAQIMPGPNVANLCITLGNRYFGWTGAVAALSGLILAPLILLLSIAIVFGGISDNPMAQGALKGMGAVSAGVIMATGLKLSSTLPHNPMGLWPAAIIAAAAFISVGIFRVPLVWAILSIGCVGYFLAHRALTRLSQNQNMQDRSGK